MSDTSRRGFIAAGGAGLGAVAVAGAGAVTGSASAATARPSKDRAQERVVAHVPDHAGDELQLLVGEREVVVHDRDLVVRLLNAAGRR